MNKLLIGLGNPGKKYELTRHNIGFAVLDALAAENELKFSEEEKFKTELAELKVGNDKILLAKPGTFMNDSGTAVKSLLDFYKIKPDQILVVHDEVDLPFGKIRLSQSSGSAGHRGVESIINSIGTKNFDRLRIGVEQRESRLAIPTEDYILMPFAEEERKALAETILHSALAEIKKWLK